jgi:hypothetical protein
VLAAAAAAGFRRVSHHTLPVLLSNAFEQRHPWFESDSCSVASMRAAPDPLAMRSIEPVIARD